MTSHANYERNMDRSSVAVRRSVMGGIVLSVALILVAAAPAQASTGTHPQPTNSQELVATTEAGSPTAGTNIGNAAQLTGQATGSITTATSDDWWVVYPAVPGGSIQVKITNTSSSSANCFLYPELSGSNGLGDNGVGSVLSSGQVYDPSYHTLNSSDRYFIDLSLNQCSPVAGKSVTYSLNLQSGGGGVAPSPSTGSASPGASIDTQTALRGDTTYTGSIGVGGVGAWFMVDKVNDSTTGTVRIENTTRQYPSPPCALSVNWMQAQGYAPGGTELSADQAVTPEFPYGGSQIYGRFYLALSTNPPDCAPGATPVTYRIEPESGTEWEIPTPLSTQTMPEGSSDATAGGPLAGGVNYQGSIPATGSDVFATISPTLKASATVEVYNTTSWLSACSFLVVTSSTGQVWTLNDDTGGSMSFDTPGPIYLDFSNEDCQAGSKPPTTVGVQITPNNSVYPLPASQMHISAAGKAFIRSYETYEPKPYDTDGNCTVGWGHLVHLGKCTAADLQKHYSSALLAQYWTKDVANAEHVLYNCIGTVPLTQQQFDALGDFAFNEGHICGSGYETIGGDLLANPPKYSSVPSALMLYDTNGHGTAYCGLWRRRLDEGRIWTSGVYMRTYPTCPTGTH